MPRRRTAFHALTNLAAEAAAEFVLGKSTGAVLLLTACIEWFTQRSLLLDQHVADDDARPRRELRRL